MIECNGYIIIQMEACYHPRDIEGGVAIAKAKSPKTPAQWVTWEWKVGQNGFDFYWGHYYTQETEARNDYHLRLAEIWEWRRTHERDN